MSDSERSESEYEVPYHLCIVCENDFECSEKRGKCKCKYVTRDGYVCSKKCFKQIPESESDNESEKGSDDEKNEFSDAGSESE